MIVVPKEKPVIKNLNSYYLDIRRLFEHFQGELGSGAIYFKSPSAEGIVFFDRDEIVTGIYQEKKERNEGRQALERLVERASVHNFLITIYEISSERVYFWANFPEAKKIYENLSTDFTDLEGLIKKMGSESFTGYIDVSLKQEEEAAVVFINNGEIIGGSYSWAKGSENSLSENLDLLIEKTKKSGGIFQVSRIPSHTEIKKNEGNGERVTNASDILSILENLLCTLEKLVTQDKKIKSDFMTLLKKKFIQMADTYAFLDPFDSEFEYSNQKISFVGTSDYVILAKGVVEAVKSLAEDLHLLPTLINELVSQSGTDINKLTPLGINL